MTKPFDIDANSDDANWLHHGPPKYKGKGAQKMTSTPSPNATVGSVHHSSPQGALTIRPRGSNLPKPKRPKQEKLHEPTRRNQQS